MSAARELCGKEALLTDRLINHSPQREHSSIEKNVVFSHTADTMLMSCYVEQHYYMHTA